MSFKFQVITFEDHFHDAEWIDPQTYKPKECIVMYCGWVTKETDTMIVISQGRTVKDKDSDVEYDGHMHIMKNCIITRKTISKKEMGKK